LWSVVHPLRFTSTITTAVKCDVIPVDFFVALVLYDTVVGQVRGRRIALAGEPTSQAKAGKEGTSAEQPSHRIASHCIASHRKKKPIAPHAGRKSKQQRSLVASTTRQKRSSSISLLYECFFFFFLQYCQSTFSQSDLLL
jgi:hypothetical protein